MLKAGNRWLFNMAKNYKNVSGSSFIFSHLKSVLMKYCKLDSEKSYGILKKLPRKENTFKYCILELTGDLS